MQSYLSLYTQISYSLYIRIIHNQIIKSYLKSNKLHRNIFHDIWKTIETNDDHAFRADIVVNNASVGDVHVRQS